MENVIDSYNRYVYYPSKSEDVDKGSGKFSIQIFNEDIVSQPSQSLLLLNGRVNLFKEGDVAGARERINLAQLSIVTNGLLHLFDRIDYYIGDTEIDSIRKPGIACLLKGLATLQDDRMYSDAGWQIQAPETTLLNEDGYFQAVIPMSLVMGFFQDFTKFIYQMRQKLVFHRNSVDCVKQVLVQDVALDKKYISIQVLEVAWSMPQIKFSLAYETRIRNEILQNTTYELSFRNWYYASNNTVSGVTKYTWDIPVARSKTKFILIGMQTGRANSKTKNSSKFDLCDLENVQVQLNDAKYYPRERLGLKQSERRTAALYHMFKTFKSAYYEDSEHTQPLIEYGAFLASYPIIAIDCSYQPDVIKESLINLKIHF
ncbi:hypothetical protein V9T40_007011 [Parthenolecanium corni]|uniref:Double jelly roll-like domain-containing protein n=1 Tax=Parthenolecanium corni TaxID=536013 RepID=A0AAN9U4I8_9HEMI